MQKQLVGWALIAVTLTGSAWAKTKKEIEQEKRHQSAAAKKKKKSAPEANSSVSSSSASGAAFDASSLQSVAPENKANEYKTNGNSRGRREYRKNDNAPKGLMNVDTKEILATLRGINLLLSKKPSESDRVKLLLNRAMASYSLARRRLIESKGLQVDANGRKLLGIAQKDSATVAAMPNMPRAILAKSNYISGLSLIYLDNSKGARERFEKAIEQDPASENTGWMALYIAEELFDTDQFRDAISYYQRYMPRMDAREQELSKYKLAWCYINLQQNDRAKRYFMDLIKADSTTGFGKDSIKDLAFLVAVGGNEDEIFRTADSVFRDKPDQQKIDFLSAVSANLEAQGNIRLFARLVDRLLKLEKDPTKRMQYMIAAVRISRREFASKAHYNSMIRVRDFLDKEGLYPGKQAFEDQRASLDLEAQNILKSYVETFAGRTKTPEDLSHVQIGQDLKTLFAFYHKYFPESKTYPAVAKLWLDVCIEMGDWNCVDQTADMILNNDKLADLQPKAAFEQLAALDRLKGKGRADQPETDRDKKLLKKLEDFVANQEENPRWLEMATRLGDLYSSRKDYGRSIPLFDRLFQKDPTPDAHYRLGFARFQAGKFEELAQEKRLPKGKVDPRYNDLKREAALKLASQSRDKDDIESYQTHIREFLASNPAADKAMAARKDSMNFLLSKDRLPELTTDVLATPAAQRLSPEFKDLLEATWVRNMRSGHFKDASALVSPTDSKTKVNTQNKSRRFLAQLCLGRVPPQTEFRELAQENRQYIGGLLALTKPRQALRYFDDRERDKILRGEERPLAALALRIEGGNWSLRPTERNARMLGSSFAFQEAPKTGELSVEKRIHGIVIPSSKISQGRLAVATEQLIRDTRYVRGRIAKEIAGKPTGVQLRTVKAARALEEKVGAFIKNSPLPPNLQPNQVEEYEKAIAEAAKEYETQAAEFAKLEESIGQTLQKGEADMAQRQMLQPDMSQWAFPDFFKSDKADGLRAMVDAGNWTAALITLDLFRPEPLKDAEDYYRIRAGILLMSRDAESMRRYVADELESNGQKKILDQWRAMTAQAQGQAAPNQGAKQDADL